ncbi:hypothetical protein [Streptomyces sp. NPDC098781]|uniref:hypothetical protein n=1 Tax=Streptomyces sp. NPDC098781 TaxID=3366097 RepID=UPI003821741A
MAPETHLVLHHAHAAELRAEADTHRLASRTGQPSDMRTRLGWTLVEVGLRLATPKPALAR